jgi:hypothetical protein
MTRALATILLVGATIQPAQACHRFTRWHFPWPQRCGLIVKPERQARLTPTRPAPAEVREIVVTPELLDEHYAGIAKLKALQQ